MKKALLIIGLFTLLFSNKIFSQLAEGNYEYSNKDITLKFAVSDNGFTLSMVTIIMSESKKTYKGKGDFKTGNKIPGYEFITSQMSSDGMTTNTVCSYDFDMPVGNALVLDQYSCKDGQPEKTFTLTKPLANWNGTYKNQSGGILVITNYKAGGFNYNLTYGGTSSCKGLVLSGTAKTTSNFSAYSMDDASYPSKFEMNGNKIMFDPSIKSGIISQFGNNCMRDFDNVFTR